MLQTNRKESDKEFAKYAERISRYCPYIDRAMLLKLMLTKEIKLSSAVEEKISEELFYEAVLLTERFRSQRSELSKKVKPFFTYNLIFDSDDKVNHNWEKIVSWPHYMLKIIYTKEQIMFGKFWNGEKTKSKFNDSIIPSPTLNFLSIRTAIKNRDPMLIEITPEILNDLKFSEMTNNNVHLEFCPNLNELSLLSFRENDYYNKLKQIILSKMN